MTDMLCLPWKVGSFCCRKFLIVILRLSPAGPPQKVCSLVPKLHDVGWGLDDHWKSMAHKNWWAVCRSTTILELTRMLIRVHWISYGYDRRCREWRDVVADSYDCSFDDHPLARRGDRTFEGSELCSRKCSTPAAILLFGSRTLPRSRDCDPRMRSTYSWKRGVVACCWPGNMII